MKQGPVALSLSKGFDKLSPNEIWTSPGRSNTQLVTRRTDTVTMTGRIGFYTLPLKQKKETTDA